MPTPRQFPTDSSFITLSAECWLFWGPLIEDLHKNHEFPAGTLETLNGCLSIFHGEGSTFRLETEQYKMFLDVIRQGDLITDIVAITLISKLDDDARSRTGWVIARPCSVHGQGSSSSSSSSTAQETGVKREPSPSGDGQLAKPAWYRIADGGKRSGHCCVMECAGPFKEGKWKIYDTTRLSIVNKSLEQEVILLREGSKELFERLQQEGGEPLREAERRVEELGGMNAKLRSRVEELEAEAEVSGKRLQRMSVEDKARSDKYDKASRKKKELRLENRELREKTDSQQKRLKDLERDLEDERAYANAQAKELPGTQAKEVDNLLKTMASMQRTKDRQLKEMGEKLGKTERNLHRKQAALSEHESHFLVCKEKAYSAHVKIVELHKELRQAKKVSATHAHLVDKMRKDLDTVASTKNSPAAPGHITDSPSRVKQTGNGRSQNAHRSNDPNVQQRGNVPAPSNVFHSLPTSQTPIRPRQVNRAAFHGPPHNQHSQPRHNDRPRGGNGTWPQHGSQTNNQSPPKIKTPGSPSTRTGCKRKREDYD